MFPVTDSNLSADSLVEHVLARYDLGAVRHCRLHHRGLNDTYKVESSQDHTYFLRIYRADWRSREEIDTEIAILLHTARLGEGLAGPTQRRVATGRRRL